MKKSLHTVLTAAAFAVSMNNAAAMPADAAEKNATAKSSAEDIVKVTSRPEQPAYGTLPAYETTTSSIDDIITTTTTPVYTVYGTTPVYTFPTTTTVETIINQFTTTVETVYGPPAWFTSTTTTEDIINATTTVYPSTEYGPMQIFGDVNWDGTTDVFDVIALRKAVIRNEYNYNDDMNGDGELGIADLVSLQNYLLGRYTTWDEMTNPDMPTTTVENIIQTTETPTYTTYGAVTAYRPWQNAPYTNKTTQTTAKEE